MRQIKSFLILSVSLLLFTACSSNQLDSQVDEAQASHSTVKPKLPNGFVPPVSDEPEVDPNVGSLADLLAKADPIEKAEVRQEPKKKWKKPVSGELNMERLLDRINEHVNEPAITAAEIQRGYYYGQEYEKKVGTPKAWLWIEEGIHSRWASPDVLETALDVEIEELCRKTAGVYAVSCVEREIEHCEYIPASECRCLDGSIWVKAQGCILADEEGKAVTISDAELEKGWYFGLPNEKKLDTPLSWFWFENAKHSRWESSNIQ